MFRQTEVARLLEGDRKPMNGRANVFIDVGRIPDVSLSIRKSGDSRAFVAHSRKEMRLRMPELVPLRFDSVPAKPPVDHLAGRPGELGENGDVGGPIGETRPTSFQWKVSGLQEAIDIQSGENVAWVGLPLTERLLGVIW